MAKAKASTVFFCQNCGYESAKWMGQCPGCHEWNTFVEETIQKSPYAGGVSGTEGRGRTKLEPSVLADIAVREEDRLQTGIGELDRVLGGGVVKGRRPGNRKVHPAFAGMPESGADGA